MRIIDWRERMFLGVITEEFEAAVEKKGAAMIRRIAERNATKDHRPRPQGTDSVGEADG
jgi:hypothetical protein